MNDSVQLPHFANEELAILDLPGRTVPSVKKRLEWSARSELDMLGIDLHISAETLLPLNRYWIISSPKLNYLPTFR